MIIIRPYTPADREFLLSLAPRLTVTMPTWRDPALCLKAVERWITGGIEQFNQKGMIFVADREKGESLGFANVSQTVNFLGEPAAYLGLLATAAEAEGSGVGKILLQACEAWARERGLPIISLDTGKANSHAMGFYHHFGYTDEVVKLSKLL